MSTEAKFCLFSNLSKLFNLSVWDCLATDPKKNLDIRIKYHLPLDTRMVRTTQIADHTFYQGEKAQLGEDGKKTRKGSGAQADCFANCGNDAFFVALQVGKDQYDKDGETIAAWSSYVYASFADHDAFYTDDDEACRVP